MKKLLSFACMGVLCLLLSSNQAFAQVSRKGGKDQPKVVLKKDKNEKSQQDTPAETRSGRTRTETNQDRTSTPSRTKTEPRSFPDRRGETTNRQEPSTRERRRLPETEPRFPRSERRYPTENRRTDRRDEDYGSNRRSSGDDRHFGDYHDENCSHPGKGRHLGWHKQKGKNKQKHKNKGKGRGGRH